VITNKYGKSPRIFEIFKREDERYWQNTDEGSAFDRFCPSFPDTVFSLSSVLRTNLERQDVLSLLPMAGRPRIDNELGQGSEIQNKQSKISKNRGVHQRSLASNDLHIFR
jgi:hypothetical protein